jgi:hypothetical protein
MLSVADLILRLKQAARDFAAQERLAGTCNASAQELLEKTFELALLETALNFGRSPHAEQEIASRRTTRNVSAKAGHTGGQ